MGIRNKFGLLFSSEVYPPQEDTWFLTEVLREFINNETDLSSKIVRACEIGLGSGYISTTLGSLFPNIHFIGIDILFQAVKLSYENMQTKIPFNRFSLICSSLLNALNPRTFIPDVIYFNPPYVRTSTQEFERIDDPLIKSWAGGPSGISVINQFLNDLKKFNFGVAFFISSSLNENYLFENNYQEFFSLDITAKKKNIEEKLICYQVTKL